jgi:hypothetical protein
VPEIIQGARKAPGFQWALGARNREGAQRLSSQWHTTVPEILGHARRPDFNRRTEPERAKERSGASLFGEKLSLESFALCQPSFFDRKSPVKQFPHHFPQTLLR